MKVLYVRLWSIALLFSMSSSLLSCSNQRDPKGTETSEMIAKSLREHENRVRYRKLDVVTLNGIVDDKLEQSVMDYVDYKLGGNYAQEKKIVNGLSPGVRALYITWWLEAEVNNGGFNQYFWNSAGQFSGTLVESLKFFDATKHAELVSEALAVRDAEASAMAEFKRAGTLEAFSESYKHSKLGVIDEKFFKTQEKLSALRIAKIRTNPELFVGE